MRLVLCENEPGDADRLIQALGDTTSVEVVGIARDGLECAMMVTQLRPDLALIRANMAALDGGRVARLNALTSPDTISVLVADDEAAANGLLKAAMRSGARAVTHLDADPAQLVGTLQELLQLRPSRTDDDYLLVSDPRRLPVTISVTGSKGGIGKTTTATNLALAMQQRFPGQVVLVDFVGHYGDISLMLDLKPQNNILDLAGLKELDADIVQAMVSVHSSGLHVMAGVNSADTLTATGRLSPMHVAGLLGVLRRIYRIIVIDVPALAYPLSQYLYQRSTYICLLTCLSDLTTVRSTASLMQSLLAQRIPANRVKLVVSRHDTRDTYSVAQLEDSLKHQAAVLIPAADEVATTALNRG
ncbi:MAG: AAA family ATPase, partial [Armatimonadia bacterium]